MARRKKRKLSFVQALLLAMMAPTPPTRRRQHGYWRREKDVLSEVRAALTDSTN